MSIEIRELVIKANIVEPPASNVALDGSEHTQMMKEEILNECRQLILSMIRERGER
ncbi:DUF5908 family protein [Undibacterium flavidum]|uniref:Uncharacterized protein n=1 Tax=Undibacterium flavidum TaxID=2762297 RepID=A0ABR6YFL2_9BURK|nr:DUF5908 family protein [Undibacterium flavidum]MBC3875297.1 hypothetical protein [Undibacterium flavidum]